MRADANSLCIVEAMVENQFALFPASQYQAIPKNDMPSD
jgi:hypothetical protein